MQITVYREDTIEAGAPEALPQLLTRDAQAVWVDLRRERPEDTRLLAEVFGFHPLAVEDALKTGQRPKIEAYDDHLFLTVHTPQRHPDGTVEFEEVDLFFTRQAVVSVRSGSGGAVEEAAHRLARSAPRLRRSPDYVLYTLLDAAVDTYFPVLDEIDEAIDRLEDRLFRRPSSRMLSTLFRLKRTLLEARRHVVPLRDTLNVLMRREAGLVTEAVILYFRDIYDHVLRLTDQIDTHRDLLTGALEIYLSQVSNRLNEVMKILTAITAIFAVWTVVGGIYGMNFARPWPSFDAPWGFGWAIGLMVGLTLVLVAIFRRRGYL